MHEIKTISDLLKIDTEHWQARDEEIKAWEKAQAEREKTERYKRQAPARYCVRPCFVVKKEVLYD